MRNVHRVRDVTPFYTAKWLYQAAERAAGEPEAIYLSRAIVRQVRERDKLSEALAISDYVNARTRYTLDPQRYEVAFGPDELFRLWRQLGRWSEDCETMAASALYTLLRSIGHTTRLVLASFDSNPLPEHIFVEDLIGGRWYALDPTEKENTPAMIAAITHRWEIPEIRGDPRYDFARSVQYVAPIPHRSHGPHPCASMGQGSFSGWTTIRFLSGGPMVFN
jgi:hypothetical protein